jgi:hypothetical protein
MKEEINLIKNGNTAINIQFHIEASDSNTKNLHIHKNLNEQNYIIFVFISPLNTKKCCFSMLLHQKWLRVSKSRWCCGGRNFKDFCDSFEPTHKLRRLFDENHFILLLHKANDILKKKDNFLSSVAFHGNYHVNFNSNIH